MTPTRRPSAPARRRGTALHLRFAVPLAGVVLGLVLLGLSWIATHPRGPVDQPATGHLVDIVDTASIAVPARGSDAAPSGRGARGASGQAVPQPDPAWVRRTAARTGISAVAVRAYGRASLLAASERPGCHLGWATVAAVGRVESVHGTLGGRRLLRDGHSSRPIVGPALDGAGGFAAIRPDADGTRLHGDPDWDHAVGPMQFLTGSWRLFGADADGDGRADPTDLDDAAWAAGRHLCAEGLDLRRGPDWTRAVLGYNASEAYVRRVFGMAQGYARAAAHR